MVNDAAVPAIGIGTHYPNRLFVGSLPGSASASDLAEFFKKFGTVLEGKVVLDLNGNSRRFGFVTFATMEDVKRVLNQGVIFFKGKQITVGPAVKRLTRDVNGLIAPPEVSVPPTSPLHCKATPVCKMHHVSETPTPSLSPLSPVSGQRLFIGMGQHPPKSVFQNSHLASAQQHCIISCSRIPVQTNVTSLHLPCQNLPTSPNLPIISMGGQLPHVFKTVNFPVAVPTINNQAYQIPYQKPYLKQG